MKRLLFASILFLSFSIAQGQSNHYESAYSQLEAMLSETQPVDVAKAIFVVENAYYDNELSYATFDAKVQVIVDACNQMIAKRGIGSYTTASNWAIFAWMTEAHPENGYKEVRVQFR